MLRDMRLNEQRGFLGVKSDRKPVQKCRVSVFGGVCAVLVVGGQCVPVSYTVKAVVLVVVLQADKVAQCSCHVAKMKRPRWSHKAQYS